ncbi:hypothetical protein MNEG_6246, partial [Monoraphidium neglectum]
RPQQEDSQPPDGCDADKDCEWAGWRRAPAWRRHSAAEATEARVQAATVGLQPSVVALPGHLRASYAGCELDADARSGGASRGLEWAQERARARARSRSTSPLLMRGGGGAGVLSGAVTASASLEGALGRGSAAGGGARGKARGTSAAGGGGSILMRLQALRSRMGSSAGGGGGGVAAAAAAAAARDGAECGKATVGGEGPRVAGRAAVLEEGLLG